MSLAEFISFEQLLGVMMTQQKVPMEVIELLWAVFSKFIKSLFFRSSHLLTLIT
jgi:hypothetical protein